MKNQLLKTILLTLILSVLLVYAGYAAQHTVSKDPNRAAQYTDLQLAISSAAPGDTILVYGATSGYGNINVYKPLTLVGEGYNPNNGLVASISSLSITRQNTTTSANGTTIMGFDISSTLSFDANFTGATDPDRVLENITFMRNKVRYVSFSGTGVQTITNINFINNIITDYVSFGNETFDITFFNNIMDGVYLSSTLNRSGGTLTTYYDLTNVKFYNNLFLAYSTGLLLNVVGTVFEDNMFIGHQLYYGDYENITWNNNLFHHVDHTGNPGLFENNNVGSGNLVDTDPLFTNYPDIPAAFSYAHDYTLQGGSSALTASASEEEIGINGGAYPFSVGAAPPVPQITEVTIQDGTSSVPVGGTINFNFKAQSGN